jgi:FKBP-type peptidyl-prolyl cis-trans isomerase
VAPRFLLILLSFLVFLLSCKEKKTEQNPHFSYHPLGYYYQLLAFETENTTLIPGKIAWLSATFTTQSDSIFWDTFNNMNDKFYVRTDTATIYNLITHYVSRLAGLDSACILIKPRDFFTQQFKSDTIPFFSKSDSCVKIFLKVKQLYSEDEFLKVQQDLELNEMRQIYKFYTNEAEAGAAMDPMGFYWLEKNGPETGPAIKAGNTISIDYEGYFLNGRFLESSGNDFELKYGTPDQLLKGLNYVISQLKLGQNAKIILPSRLAFGENGSSNGIVPPYSPLLYKIKLTDIKE